MSTKVKFNKGQYNRYTSGSRGSHEHEWYRPSTGQSGWHGSAISPTLKKESGRAFRAGASSVFDTTSGSGSIYRKGR